jgi:hypothetical protein
MLSEDDLNLQELSDDELVRAWDLWFDLAQVTNDSDPAYSHGVFVGVEPPSVKGSAVRSLRDQSAARQARDEAR